jgi:hypothetical protein
MRRLILAGAKTFAAVMAEIRQVIHVRFGEGQTLFHGGKNRAEPFAITASIADRHDPLAFAYQLI